MQNKQLVGAWKLVSCEARSSSGEVSYPYGRNPFGMLLYDSGGNVFVLVMRADRPKFASDDLWRGTPEEIRAAFEGFNAYCGTYEVNEKKGMVTHHVEGSSSPNWVGVDQERSFKCSGDQLTLSTPPMPVSGSQSTVHLIWARTRSKMQETSGKTKSPSPGRALRAPFFQSFLPSGNSCVKREDLPSSEKLVWTL